MLTPRSVLITTVANGIIAKNMTHQSYRGKHRTYLSTEPFLARWDVVLSYSGPTNFYGSEEGNLIQRRTKKKN
jgi:hypothetical protein